MLISERSINSPFDRIGKAVHQWGKSIVGTPLERAAPKIGGRKRSIRAMQYQQERYQLEVPIPRTPIVEPSGYHRSSNVLDSRFGCLSSVNFDTPKSRHSSMFDEEPTTPITEDSAKQKQVTFSDRVDFAEHPSLKKRWSQMTCITPVVHHNTQEAPAVVSPTAADEPAEILPAMKVWNIDDSAQFVQLMDQSPMVVMR
jgi:hypothetical protein